MRGGVSHFYFHSRLRLLSSPHAWGCFYASRVSFALESVFPTCVGVFPYKQDASRPKHRLPHMRGGVSVDAAKKAFWRTSSPHAWGCFFLFLKVMATGLVFPTCVGVFLNYTGLIWLDASLPHMRGGVSTHYDCPIFLVRSSPHAWGCFLLTFKNNSIC